MSGIGSTIKLVVIGPSGVGKTSLRGQYVSGRFSTGYRATIGADFISKTVSLKDDETHPANGGMAEQMNGDANVSSLVDSDANDAVTLQIWDTAGQERFSALSSAFFRGADAVLLVFDVSRPDTLTALERWWAEFCHNAPVPEDRRSTFCCVVVGNKTDQAGEGRVTEADAKAFVERLVPEAKQAHMPTANGHAGPANGHASPTIQINGHTTPTKSPTGRVSPTIHTNGSAPPGLDIPRMASSASVRRRSKSATSKRSRSASASRFGTLTSVASFHTARSGSTSFDESEYVSAPSRPLSPSGGSSFRSGDGWGSIRSAKGSLTKRIRHTSTRSVSSASEATTITPTHFARSNAPTSTHTQVPASAVLEEPPSGPAVFFTSAKTGAGVRDVFEYVARRVAARWAWEEARADDWEDVWSNDAGIRLSVASGSRFSAFSRRGEGGKCC